MIYGDMKKGNTYLVDVFDPVKIGLEPKKIECIEKKSKIKNTMLIRIHRIILEDQEGNPLSPTFDVWVEQDYNVSSIKEFIDLKI